VGSKLKEVIFIKTIWAHEDNEFQYYVGLSVLEQHRRQIMEELDSFDDILKVKTL
jgi:hypothetical protein